MKSIIANFGSKTGEKTSRDVLYGCWCKGKKAGNAEYPPLPLLYVYTLLKENSFDVSFIDAQGLGLSHTQFIDNVDANEFDVLITQTSTMTFRDDVSLLEAIKRENHSIKTVLIGSHVTFLPEKSLSEDSVDYVILYEPEKPVLELLSGLRENRMPDRLDSVGFKDGGGYIVGDRKSLIDLDETPIPDRTPILEIDYYNPLVEERRWTSVETTRGCPGKCTFCTAPSFFGEKVRARRVDDVIKELEILSSLGYREIFFRDETFTYDLDRVKEICQKMIERSLDLKWICNSRVNTINPQAIESMKSAGCRKIKYGVETGSPEILKNIRKGTTIQQAEKAFKWMCDAGLESHGHFMLGCPGETMQSIRKTIDFAKKLNPTTASFGIFTPYPGTKIYKDFVKKLPDDWDGTEAELSKLHVKSFYNEKFTELTSSELEKAMVDAYREFYLRPGYVLNKLSTINTPTDLFNTIKSGIGVLSYSLTGRN